MKCIYHTFFAVAFFAQPTFAQEAKPPRAKNYFSIRLAMVAPLGAFDDFYKGAIGIEGIMHLKWLDLHGGEVQIVSGFERFNPKKGNIFGNITILPLKMGIMKMVSKEFFFYGRAGIVGIKDQKSSYAVRFSTDVGFGYGFKKIAADVGFHGWVKQAGGGYSNYFSAGIMFPFHRSY